MKLHYFPETDSLHIDLREQSGVDTDEITDGVVLDLDGEGQSVGIDIQHASRTVDLSALETTALPALHLNMA